MGAFLKAAAAVVAGVLVFKVAAAAIASTNPKNGFIRALVS